MTLGTTPKKAPPSSGYVPSEKTVSSKSPRVRRCMESSVPQGGQKLLRRGFVRKGADSCELQSNWHEAATGRHRHCSFFLAGGGLSLHNRGRHAGSTWHDLDEEQGSAYVRTGTRGTLHDSIGWVGLGSHGMGIVSSP